MHNADTEYVCSGCGRPIQRDLLSVKKVSFQEMGSGAKTLRSRVKGWYCPPCVKADPDWKLEPYRHPNERREESG